MALYLSQRNRPLVDTRAFLYRWTHIPSNKWYVGSRTAYGCHPADGYICSSIVVKEMIRSCPEDWVREILVIGEPSEILKTEHAYLMSLNAKHDDMSFNQHNGDGNWTTLGTKWSEQQRLKAKKSFSESRTGKAKSLSHKLAISKALSRKERTKEHGDAIGRSLSIGMYTNDGVNKFYSSRAAAKFAGISQPTLRKWVKNNTNGWYFVSKENI